MELNRRDFLALSGSVVALRLDPRQPRRIANGVISVWHSETDGSLHESVDGYRRALEGVNVQFKTVDANAAAASAHSLIAEASRGATVVVESGVAPHGLLADLGVRASDSVHLWRRGFPVPLWRRDFSPAGQSAACPYVNYTWPLNALVRDFSFVVSLSGPGWQPIAYVNEICVGLTRRVGLGRMVMLGSPLGPVLRGGDREAHEWLAALVAVTARS